MQTLNNPYLEFANQILNRHRGCGFYYDPLSLIFLDIKESDKETETVIKQTIHNLKIIQQENKILNKNLSFITNVFPQNIMEKKTVNIENIVVQQLEEVSQSIEIQLLPVILKQYQQILNKQSNTSFVQTNFETKQNEIIQEILKENHISESHIELYKSAIHKLENIVTAQKKQFYTYNQHVYEKNIVKKNDFVKVINKTKSENISNDYLDVKHVSQHLEQYKLLENLCLNNEYKINNHKNDIVIQNREFLNNEVHKSEIYKNSNILNRTENNQIVSKNVITTNKKELKSLEEITYNPILLQQDTQQFVHRIESLRELIQTDKKTTSLSPSSNILIENNTNNTIANIINNPGSMEMKNVNNSISNHILNHDTLQFVHHNKTIKEVKQTENKTSNLTQNFNNVIENKTQKATQNTTQNTNTNIINNSGSMELKNVNNSISNHILNHDTLQFVHNNNNLKESKNIENKTNNTTANIIHNQDSIELKHINNENQNIQKIESDIKNYVNQSVYQLNNIENNKTYNSTEQVQQLQEIIAQNIKLLYKQWNTTLQLKNSYYKSKVSVINELTNICNLYVNGDITQNVFSDQVVKIAENNIKNIKQELKQEIIQKTQTNHRQSINIQNILSKNNPYYLLRKTIKNYDIQNQYVYPSNITNNVSNIDTIHNADVNLVQSTQNETVSNKNFSYDITSSKVYDLKQFTNANQVKYIDNISFLQNIHLQDAKENIVLKEYNDNYSYPNFHVENTRQSNVSQKYIEHHTHANVQNENSVTNIQKRQNLLKQIYAKQDFYNAFENNTYMPAKASIAFKEELKVTRQPIDFIYEVKTEEKVVPSNKESTKEITKNTVVEDVVNEVVQDITFVNDTKQVIKDTLRTQKIQNIQSDTTVVDSATLEKRRILIEKQVEETVQKRVDESLNKITDKIYQKLESRLKSERNRRGFAHE